MGPTRLKAKDNLNYRRTGSGRPNCGRCAHIVREFQIRSLSGHPLAIEPRCIMMGLDSSHKHRIRLDHVCDKIVDTFKCPSEFKKVMP